MKKITTVFFILFLLCLIPYLIIFVRSNLVTSAALVTVESQNATITITTAESAKFITDYAVTKVSDSLVEIRLYTTTSANIFAKKTIIVAIPLNEKVKRFVLAGKEFERSKLSCDPRNGGLAGENMKVLSIGHAIAYKVYGRMIDEELPLHAALKGDSIWVVKGTMREGEDGGAVYIELSRGGCQVLQVTHYK